MRAQTPAIFAAALAMLALAGCPRELQPPPPGDASLCDDHADCNGGRTCGALALCLGDEGATGYCEREPSVEVACPDDGVPVPVPSDPDVTE